VLGPLANHAGFRLGGIDLQLMMGLGVCDSIHDVADRRLDIVDFSAQLTAVAGSTAWNYAAVLESI
jgi:hypothetical protein